MIYDTQRAAEGEGSNAYCAYNAASGGTEYADRRSEAQLSAAIDLQQQQQQQQE